MHLMELLQKLIVPCTWYQLPCRYLVPGYLPPGTWYLLHGTQVPGMKIVPGSRKHASATAGASWNCCESSRCLKLDYVLPLTLALPLVRRPDLLEKVSNSGFGRAGQSAANSRLSCVTARPRLTPPPALGTGSGFGGKEGELEGGEGCILPLKGRLPLLADGR